MALSWVALRLARYLSRLFITDSDDGDDGAVAEVVVTTALDRVDGVRRIGV